MERHRQLPSVGALLALLVVCACSPRFPDISWKGKYLHFAQTADGEVCAGSNPYQDRYIELLAARLGVELDEPIRFAYIERDELDDYCFQSDIWGCYYDDRSYGIEPVLTHELAHAVAERAGWVGPRSFTEGFAEAYGNNFDAGVERLPIRDVIENFEVAPDHYYTAGLFVRYLIERHGVALFGDFMRETGRDDELESLYATFQAVFAEPMETAFIDFDDYPTCAAWANHDAVVECSLADVAWNGGILSESVSLDCSDEEVIGPLLPGPRMWGMRAFSVEKGGDFLATVTTTGAADSGVRITRCGSCVDSIDEIIIAGSERELSLTQGRYYVVFIADVEDTSVVSFSLEPSG